MATTRKLLSHTVPTFEALLDPGAGSAVQWNSLFLTDAEEKSSLHPGDSIPHEYLVLETGSSAGLPSRVCQTDKDTAMKAIADQRKSIREAQDIVIVGGGSAGVELAADAKTRFPENQVTLIHSRKTLLNDGFGMKLHHAICDEMGSLGVNLMLGEKPVIPDGTTGDIKLSGGNALNFDCLVSCQFPLFPGG